MEIAAGGALAYAGLIVLLIGIALLVSRILVGFDVNPETAVWLGPTLVGMIVAIVGGVMLSKAKNAMSGDKLFPRETVESLKEDKRWVQSKLSQHHS
jgi:membrane-bound ClpP family serine protease